MLVEFIFGREIGGATSQNLEGGHSWYTQQTAGVW
jgi:hypothetical protein